MFEFLHTFLGPLFDPSIGAVGDTSNHCPAPVPPCSTISQFHQGQIVVPRAGDTGAPLDHVKFLNPVRFNSHTSPQFLTATGPSVKTDDTGKIFAFTARVDPDSALVDGVRIDWSSPPDAARVLVSPNDSALHEATGWIPTKANGRFAGGVPQSQNVIFSRPEWVKQISVEMRDAPNSTKTQFGIQQVALVTNIHDFSNPPVTLN